MYTNKNFVVWATFAYIYHSLEGCRLVRPMFPWRLPNAAESKRELWLLSCCCCCLYAETTPCLLAEQEVCLGALGGTKGWNCCSLVPGAAAELRFQTESPWKWQWPQNSNSDTFVFISLPRGNLTLDGVTPGAQHRKCKWVPGAQKCLYKPPEKRRCKRTTKCLKCSKE